MPIKPENRHRYPLNWREIRNAVVEEAGHKCEFCGVPNGEIVVRKTEHATSWEVVDDVTLGVTGQDTDDLIATVGRTVKIVLTVAHLDHQPEHNERANLRALCQLCHLRWDAKHHAHTRAVSRLKESGQLSILNPRAGQ